MPNIQINIKDKVARGDGTIIVCGNSDYVAHFDFDSEWDEYTTKTAHFEWGGKYEDRVFTGNECAVPVVYSINALTIGVFAGDIRSTTPAFFKCVPCGQDSDSIPADPTPDVYNQIMELLNNISLGGNPATTETLGLIKVGENLTITEDGVLSVDTATQVEQDNTKPITSAAVHTEIGNIDVLLKTI